MVTGLVCAALLSVDGGDVRADTKRLLDAVFAQQRAQDAERNAQLVAQVRAARDAAAGEERELLDRMLRFVASDEPLDKKTWPEWVQLNRDLLKLSRGDWEAERAAVGAFSSLGSLAQTLSLDPEPYRRESVLVARDLVTRWPAQGRAHGLLASALLQSGAENLAVLPELKRCVQLDATADWCKRLHASLVDAAERPRCSGKQLTQTLTSTAAHDWQKGQTGTVIESYGMKLLVEEHPFLFNEDYALIAVDQDGNLDIEVTQPAMKRLETETTRLVRQSGTVVMRLGDEVILSAHVNEPIANGRLHITHGAKGPPFVLDKLCRSVDRPSLPAALKL
jgi:hypothetical protein